VAASCCIVVAAMTSSFVLQPVLVGELLSLRPLSPLDFEPLYRIAADPLIWEQHPQRTRHERAVFAQYFEGAMKSGGALVVQSRQSGALIGCSRYYDLSADGRRIIIGYTFLTRAHWGGRYNRELKHLMLAHAFQFVDVVAFEIGVSNLRSRRAIEKLGARLVHEADLDGSTHVVYEIRKEDFARLCGPSAGE
jgi:hypothetical protein